MNRTATLRERRSAAIAEAALADPSTAEMLREAGLPSLYTTAQRETQGESRAASEASSGDSPERFCDDSYGSLWDGSDDRYEIADEMRSGC